jgi:hypothetical protein
MCSGYASVCARSMGRRREALAFLLEQPGRGVTGYSGPACDLGRSLLFPLSEKSASTSQKLGIKECR